ncbi:TPA: flagellin [Streptococcus suis]
MDLRETLLNKEYKDHTVLNPVDDISLEALPPTAFDVHNQPIRNVYTTIQIIDEHTGRVLETITGKAESGVLKASSESMIRRSIALSLAVDKDIFPAPNSLIWFNKIAKVYVGIKNNAKKNDLINFLIGTYWITIGKYKVNGAESRVELEMEDKMSKWIDKQLEFPIKINRDTPINVAIQAVMEHIGETEFGYIAETLPGEVVPFTLEFKVGDEITNVIKLLRDMYMDYTCGYDVQGRFEFRKIEVQFEKDLAETKWRFDSDDEGILKTLISFEESYDLSEIRNRIVVYGATSQRSGMTAQGEARVTDGSSPFNIYSIGEKTKIIRAEKLSTDDQCIAMARYEVFKNSSFRESCTIDTVPIYFLDVNDIITIRHPYTKVESKYIIESFTFGLGVVSTMTIVARKLYFVSVEYGEAHTPAVEAFVRGIYNHGWISLAEERIMQCYNMVADGTATLTIRFQEVISGGEQMSVTSYPTTRNQTMIIDLADYGDLDLEDENGFVIGRSRGDSAERVMAHEIFHAVMNDYVGHEKAILVPTFFQEGFAEFIHGAKERFESVFADLSQQQKKDRLIQLSADVMDGSFTGASEDYVASYLIAVAIFRRLTTQQFRSMFARIRNGSNIGINFLTKVVPIGSSDSEVKQKLLEEIRNMTPIWTALFNPNEVDTMSIGGRYFMNIYNSALTDTTIFKNLTAGDASIGFNLQIIK